MIDALPGDPVFRMLGIRLTQGGTQTSHIFNGLPLEIEIDYEVKEKSVGFRVFFDLMDSDVLLFRSFHDERGDGIPTTMPGRYRSRAIIPANLLGPQSYELRIHATIFKVRMCTPDLGLRIPLTVEATGLYNRAYVDDTYRGKLAPVIPWETTVAP